MIGRADGERLSATTLPLTGYVTETQTRHVLASVSVQRLGLTSGIVDKKCHPRQTFGVMYASRWFDIHEAQFIQNGGRSAIVRG